jgi:cytoskeletal protein CcmA (bactofilin family)
MTWLGQKSDPEPNRPIAPAPAASPQVATYPLPTEPREKPAAPKGVASIGKSLHVKGELSGQEDLAVEGKVEGKILLKGQKVTIGQTGRVAGEIHARTVVVAGLLNGDIVADEVVEVAATGTMMGDIRAPRVVLADGAKFKGSIDMDAKAASGASVAA